jgi:general secretion pathway protein B
MDSRNHQTSSILNALRQAERDRQLGRIRTLGLPPTLPKPRRRWSWLELALAVGAALNALQGFLVFHPTLLRPISPHTVIPSPMLISANSPPGKEPHMFATTSIPRPTLNAPQQTGSDVSVDLPPLKKGGWGGFRTGAGAKIPPNATLKTEETEYLQSDHLPEPLPLNVLLASARRDIPALKLEVHSHSPDRKQRFVMINGQRYREGEQLHEGPQLEAVTVNGAILRQDQLRFQLPVR